MICPFSFNLSLFKCLQGAPGWTGVVGAQGPNGSRVSVLAVSYCSNQLLIRDILTFSILLSRGSLGLLELLVFQGHRYPIYYMGQCNVPDK